LQGCNLKFKTKGEELNDCENMLVQISEFVFTEMGGVKSVKHNTEENNEQSASCVIVMNDQDTEKEFVVEIKQMK